MSSCIPDNGMKRVGIYGGSFNPIHVGHLALADYIHQCGHVDEVWFMVSPVNPFKQQADLWDDQLRFRLVQVATKETPYFQACDFEFQLERPSYTVNTLAALRAHYPAFSFSLIVGSDNWNAFRQWREPDEILRHHHILVYPRPGYQVTGHLPEHVRLMDNPPLWDISSTKIREMMAHGEDFSKWVHPEVYRILTHLTE